MYICTYPAAPAAPAAAAGGATLHHPVAEGPEGRHIFTIQFTIIIITIIVIITIIIIIIIILTVSSIIRSRKNPKAARDGHTDPVTVCWLPVCINFVFGSAVQMATCVNQ